MITLAFDVYGTLINTQGIQSELANTLNDGRLAETISRRWREKQLEYSFRRGLMERYQPFSVCTRHALQFALTEAGVSLGDERQSALIRAYRRLPAFDDAENLLRALRFRQVRAFAFTNGEAEVASELLDSAGLLELLEGLVSVEIVHTFKPSPKVYRHFLDTTDSRPERTWLISGNPFDILGAKAVGWRTAWVRRGMAQFDPWDEAPEHRLSDLSELAGLIGE